MFTHDITNLEAYPIVTVCLESVAYWWLLPLLSAVSRRLRTDLNTDYYKHAARVALRVRIACKMFRLKGEQYHFKMIFIKHIWTIWNKPGNGDPISGRLAVLLSAYGRITCYNRLSKDVIKKLGLSLLGWDPVFNLLVRLAIWMHHFGMADSTMYMVFAARMDLLYIELAKSYPYKLQQQKARFSQYIQAMYSAPTYQLWVWSITQRPRGCVHYAEMHALWSHGKRGVLQRHTESLPNYVQSLLVLLSVYVELHKRRGVYLPGKVSAMCTTAQVWLDAADDVIVID
jgi:hypothetical protein